MPYFAAFRMALASRWYGQSFTYSMKGARGARSLYQFIHQQNIKGCGRVMKTEDQTWKPHAALPASREAKGGNIPSLKHAFRRAGADKNDVSGNADRFGGAPASLGPVGTVSANLNDMPSHQFETDKLCAISAGNRFVEKRLPLPPSALAP